VTRSFLRLVLTSFVASAFVPLIVVAGSTINGGGAPSAIFFAKNTVCWAVFTMVMALVFPVLLQHVDTNARLQAEFADTLSSRYLDLAIFGSAALSLFAELAVIRWQASVFEFFALYKNFSLLSAFAGLGLGYALANCNRIPLVLVIPMFAAQFGMMTALRFGLSPDRLRSLSELPFREQLSMGAANVTSFSQMLPIYYFLAIVFVTTALTFLPLGQMCGRLMDRQEKLHAYGMNLLGSLFGVALMLLLSAFWTPPLVWYSLCFLGVLLFQVRKPVSLLLGFGFAIGALIILAWPINPLWQRLYSPYQLLEISHDDRGLITIRAAGYYYQQVHDLARSNRNVETDTALKKIRDYYELPYRIYGKPAEVAVLGAGTGNDVAAALRSGATRVDAIEIDPAILQLGSAHPEHPYSDPRVHAIVNDARSFLRNTGRTYDLIVYGLLDSHTLLSHAASVRLDSFVYTVQALREARSRLKPGGLLSLSFAIISEAIGRKVYLMMQEAFDGRPPVCVQAPYGNFVVFLQSKEGSLVFPLQQLGGAEFEDSSARYGDSTAPVDVSTDDWPFFYMPRRIYPVSYLLMASLVLALSVTLAANFVSQRPRFSQVPFFLLGSGFMLVETKGITELGLTFGNSWQVVGVVIGGILMMAFLANCVVQWLRIRRPAVPYLLLFASLAIGWFLAQRGGFPPTTAGKLAATVVLTCPILFSGIVFSTLLAVRGEIAGIMAVNLLGAMFGGLLEYNSMYFGFEFLYLIAIAVYSGAVAWSYLVQSHHPTSS